MPDIDATVAQRAQHPLTTIPDPTYSPHSRIPNTPLAVAAVSFGLGCTFSLGFVTFALGGFESVWWASYQLGFFVAAWATFHWAEFAVTAGWNLHKCSIDSFLLENGAPYHIANASAVVEYLITLWFRPQWKANPWVSLVGILLVITGQALRSGAMIFAASNFSHIIEYRKRNNHELVTTGIYAYFRHPSYTGFFYWAVGTQLVLQNPLNFCVFTVVVWRFFYYRTRAEEKLLVKFFGDEYVEYRKRVGTWIPFIP